MSRLILYTTLGCHLCDQLEALLYTLSQESLSLDKVEIADDEALLTRYGVRIPVLADSTGQELDRGFDPGRLAAWLDKRGWLDAATWQQLQQSLEGEGLRPVQGAIIRNGRRYLR